MPSKSRKVASRQAELQRQRRRTKGGRTQAFDAGPAETTLEPAAQTGVQPSQVAAAAAPRATPAPPAQATARARRRGVTKATEYPYLASELKRIGIFASLVVVALVVLTFVLR